MPVYISLLRGVNIGAHNRMKMEPLRTCLEGLGYERVRTYLQSGNAVFNCRKLSTAELSHKIEQQICAVFNLSVSVISLTAEEIAGAIRNNPFLAQRGIDTTKLLITFLSESPAPSAVKTLDSLSGGNDQFRSSGKVIYLFCPNGYGETKLSNSAFEKRLSVRATTRNWKTANSLYQMAAQTAKMGKGKD
jgi:uncharacterized protein (DUF1697 family)